MRPPATFALLACRYADRSNAESGQVAIITDVCHGLYAASRVANQTSAADQDPPDGESSEADDECRVSSSLIEACSLERPT